MIKYTKFNKKCGCCKDSFPENELEKEYLYIYKDYSKNLCSVCKDMVLSEIAKYDFCLNLTINDIRKISRYVSKKRRNLI